MRWTFPLALAFALASMSATARAGTGACCFDPCDNRECEILTEEECTSIEGATYWGDGTTCEECPIVSEVPDPSKCSVYPADAMNGLFVCPAVPVPVPASQITVTARNTCDDPYMGASVWVLLGSSNPVCGGAILEGTTNGQGEVVISLAASGCVADQPLSGVIKVNGVTIRSYENVKSPDWDGDGRVALPDLQQFSREFVDATTDRCHDYDNDGDVGLSDLVLFSPAFSNANRCAR